MRTVRRLAFVLGAGVLLLVAAAYTWVGFWTHEYETEVLPRATWVTDGRYRDMELFLKWQPIALYRASVLGDSTALGVGGEDSDVLFSPLLLDHGRGSVANFGQIGARVHDITGQIAMATKIDSQWTVVSIGANDATHLTSLSSYRTDMRVLAAYLATRPPGRTFVFTAPDMSLVPALPIGYRAVVGMRAAAENRILREEMPSSVTIVDIYHEGKLDPKVDPWLYAEDQFHPSDKGYAIWASVLEKAHRQASHP